MRRLISALGLEVFAIALAFAQSLGHGVRTDEAKYLLNIPYPQPPLIRVIMGWTEALPYQELLWRVIIATLLVQAVWIVWRLGKDLPRAPRWILSLGWLGSSAVLFQAGTIMMAPLTAVEGLLFVWLLLRPVREGEQGRGFLVAMLWLVTLFTAYQGFLYLPLPLWILRKRRVRIWQQAIYIGLPLVLLALYTLGNPLAVASFRNAGGENLDIPFALWFWYLARLWITGGSLALTVLGIAGIPAYWQAGSASRSLRESGIALAGAFLLTTAFCFASFRDYYDILFTPLFIGGAYLLFQRWHPRMMLMPFLVTLLGTTALALRFLPPITPLGPARDVMRAIEARGGSGEILIYKYFGHEWQYESHFPIRRFRPEVAKDAQAVICINPCTDFDTRGWRKLPTVLVEVWVRS